MGLIRAEFQFANPAKSGLSSIHALALIDVPVHEV